MDTDRTDTTDSPTRVLLVIRESSVSVESVVSYQTDSKGNRNHEDTNNYRWTRCGLRGLQSSVRQRADCMLPLTGCASRVHSLSGRCGSTHQHPGLNPARHGRR